MKLQFRLQELMREKGITQQALAEELDISINTLKAYKNNWILRPDLEIMAKLCDFFGITLDQLLIDIEDKRFKGKKINEPEFDPD